MNREILRADVQEFIRDNLKADLSRLILKGSPFPDVSIQKIAAQIAGLKTAEKKLPTWFKTPGIIFPPRLNLEQTSSEITAEYKASLISGKTLVDITGGLGIDTFHFSQKVEKVHNFEINKNLAEIAAHNFAVLGANNITPHPKDGLNFLRNTSENFDWIFADPARRDEHGGKVFRFVDCQPDIPANLQLLFEHTQNILIKTSPLLDLSAGIEELQNVAEIHIVAVENEVKELLWLLKKDFSSEEIRIKTINFQKKGKQEFETTLSSKNQDVEYSLPEKYLYEPNAAIMKSGCFAELAEVTATKELHPNSHLYTSPEEKEFPGRCFEVSDLLVFNKAQLKKRFNRKKANITTRNFPESVAEIRKKFKIKEGGKDYLFFTTNLKEEKIVLVCRKL
ncbi:class I SAM-dependent methyltransferase [Zunongwangia sp. F363]|uniref:Class I SAM-dependent methyltransferase n=1 Tax=Autumnicola tepida TaxID=3075595 RepID=A0ABU3C6A9_9FLAO|nr:class I SAM-dependent methyltransferase [Zunongwangia sp. F363]MDT0641876.1 class I SAM-dependent methyltransferase [Zunongwangia sp. F363]